MRRFDVDERQSLEDEEGDRKRHMKQFEEMVGVELAHH